jgi:lipoprotein-releasing system ATP-binding protein
VGFVFQDHHLLPQLTVMENVLLPTLAGKAETESSDRAREVLGRVGLSDKLTAFPSKLSGGQRQRVAVARALINQPDLLLCDEPTGSLDQETGVAIAELFVELAKTGKVMLLVVTHNPWVASKFGQRAELREGCLQTGRRLES